MRSASSLSTREEEEEKEEEEEGETVSWAASGGDRPLLSGFRVETEAMAAVTEAALACPLSPAAGTHFPQRVESSRCTRHAQENSMSREGMWPVMKAVENIHLANTRTETENQDTLIQKD